MNNKLIIIQEEVFHLDVSVGQNVLNMSISERVIYIYV